MLEKYKTAIVGFNKADTGSGNWPVSLKIRESGDLSVWYSPFYYVNKSAKIVLLGITPGRQQATNALIATQKSLIELKSNEQALRSAKVFAGFSGPMRKNTVLMLNYVGLNKVLGIETYDSLWSADSRLAHFTSVLRYPVFKSGGNYSGSPRISKNEFLKSVALKWTGKELSTFTKAWIVPLGSAAEDGLDVLIDDSALDETRILRGLPHPSGANIERI
jgi:hypothetical protein